ncbi:MMPL family transporter [Actinoplanes sp. LDG1-06]|uniref:MMPL family transporter n=1 Tax=Paractinoplanes ovalisporus TaxID=2810368 RepID=A0ABS2A6F8_9ACTN|nr:MMPL family transporter [Actinoplanes ovalisporus]MBM2615433.1 MMPL family transporter [Actinoplanes ovalisporus]
MSTIEDGPLHAVMARLAGFVTRRPWVVLGAWLLVAITVGGLVAGFGRPTEEDTTLPGSTAQHGRDLLEAHFSGSGNANGQVIYRTFPATGSAPASAGDLPDLAAPARRIAEVDHVASVGKPVVSGDGRTAYLEISFDLGPRDVTQRLTEDVLTAADVEGAEVLPAGALARPEADTRRSEAIGIVVALVVLVIAFGGLLAATLPLLTALITLVCGVGAIGLAGHLTGIPGVATTLGTMIGLGVGIDYALFLVTRYRALLTTSTSPVAAIVATVASSGSAVVFAGGTVVVALGGLAVAGVPILATLGWTAGLVVIVAVATATTLLPALLTLLGPRIRAPRTAARPAGSFWGRLADRVTRKPWPYAVTSVVVLLALAAPVVGMELGQTDPGDDPAGSDTRAGYEAMASAFGPGVNGPLTVVLPLEPPATGATDPRLASLTEAVSGVDGVASAQPAHLSTDGEVASVRVLPTTAPSDPATLGTVDRLDALAVGGADVAVTGQTAVRGALAEQVGKRMPYVIGLVVLLSALLVFVAFRAPVVAVKAALMNLLSVGAAYGVLTAVFQWGWGVELTGLDGPVPIEAYVPMMLFALLFGLSMDYEVFLLTAVRESWQRRRDNRASVRDGLAGTGVVITSAALIMVCVFASFVLSSDPVIKMMGLGLAVAIAVDATIIRGLLVPATMALLGGANWWTPRLGLFARGAGVVHNPRLSTGGSPKIAENGKNEKWRGNPLGGRVMPAWAQFWWARPDWTPEADENDCGSRQHGQDGESGQQGSQEAARAEGLPQHDPGDQTGPEQARAAQGGHQ